MGIPAYFRWISERYPKMMKDCVEFVCYDEATGEEHRIDASQRNPNGIEFDNLYLDMNGIIHPCTHPEDGPAPTTEEEMFDAVFAYIDRVFSIVRPRRILYLAIDGVAPRAKINQQRSRRFRAAREAEEARAEKNNLISEWRKLGFKVKEAPKDDDAPKPFDSNVITPGTPFMARLADALRVYVAERVATDPAWKNLRVIFSDSSVPGEGEHKIAEFIRIERAQPNYDPNIHHVMYGLDADLIMLALSTHEVRFSILREEVFPKRGDQRNGKQVGPGGSAADPQGRAKLFSYQASLENTGPDIDPKFLDDMRSQGLSLRGDIGKRKPFHFLHVNVLREYLDAEFRSDIGVELAATPSSTVVYDLERVIDDFVFLCFFVGNDFLPHLPTLDIREGAVDFLIELYKQQLPHIGYLTSDGGDVDFERARKILLPIGLREDEIFQERAANEIRLRQRQDRDRELAKMAKANREAAKKQGSPAAVDRKGRRVAPPPPAPDALVALGGPKNLKVGSGEKNASAEAALRAVLGKKGSSPLKRKISDDVTAAGLAAASKKSKSIDGSATPIMSMEELPPVIEEKSQEEFKEALSQRMKDKNLIKNPHDNVELGKEGWKDRYYTNKFHWGEDLPTQKAALMRSYFEGLYWVMKYYYSGCASWGWYYPYHYAPFASDLVEANVTTDDINFELGTPFKPFQQLQSVMPASSGKLVLPKCYSDLMHKSDSPILDYYPVDFKLDLNGKRFAWQGVALLPFIDENRLNDALNGLDEQLTDEERKRNSFGDCYVVVRRDSNLGIAIDSVQPGNTGAISSNVAEGQFFGTISSPVEGSTSKAVFSVFNLPEFSPHSSALLPTAQQLPNVLHDGHKNHFRHSGWRAARNGILGRAARDIANQRMRGANGGRGRPRSGRGRGGRQYQQQHNGNRNQNHHVNSNQVPPANSMFGGLGTQRPGHTWAQVPYQRQRNQQYQHQPQQQQQPYAYQQQRQYQNFHNSYQQQQQQQQYQYQHQQYQHQPYDPYQPQAQQYMPQQQQFNWATNPGAYMQGYRGAGGGEGGLSGPTAASFRNTHGRGRGRGRGGRGGGRR